MRLYRKSVCEASTITFPGRTPGKLAQLFGARARKPMSFEGRILWSNCEILAAPEDHIVLAVKIPYIVFGRDLYCGVLPLQELGPGTGHFICFVDYVEQGIVIGDSPKD